jgi:hypothetical protein
MGANCPLHPHSFRQETVFPPSLDRNHVNLGAGSRYDSVVITVNIRNFQDDRLERDQKCSLSSGINTMAPKSQTQPQHQPYNWRLPKPESQAKLKPLDFSALDNLFGDTQAFQELDRATPPSK